jgi:FG-GAP-like repeat/FG-GAP repeat
MPDQQTKRPGRSRRQADLSPAPVPPRAHGLRAWVHGFFNSIAGRLSKEELIMKLASWLQGVVRGSQRNRKSSRRAASRSRSASRLLSAEVLESRLLLSAVTFAPAETFSSGGSTPTSVAAGDFNSDGYADLAVVNSGSINNNVSVLLADGNGSFAPPVTFSSGGRNPRTMAVGDFNDDGTPDLAVANVSSGNVGVLLGNGDGSFASTVAFATGGEGPLSVAVGDFNNDGNADLALANFFTDDVGVLLGNGSGGFASAVTFDSGGSRPFSIAVGDFDGDGQADLVVANSESSNVGVLLGNGTGGFAPAVTFGTGGSFPFSVAVGDFNNDDMADIVVANSNGSNVGILLGDGTGDFAPAATFAVSIPLGIAVADFNNDGNTDLLVGNPTHDHVSVLLGNGLGGFAASQTFDTGRYPAAVAVADFDNDGRTDIAVANFSSDNVSVLLNTTNQPPVNTVPGDQLAAEDVAKAIGGLSVSDDVVAGILTVTFTVDHGTLAVNDSVADGLAATDISGNGTATVTLTGTQAQINATLAAADGLTYLGGPDYSGLDTLTMTTTDAGGFSDTDAVAIQVLSAQQQADAIAAFIADLGDGGVLNGGQENALITKLGFLSGANGAAVLQAFINQVNGMADAGIVTQQQRDELVAAAQSLLASLQ